MIIKLIRRIIFGKPIQGEEISGPCGLRAVLPPGYDSYQDWVEREGSSIH
jgi:hypothetical protein